MSGEIEERGDAEGAGKREVLSREEVLARRKYRKEHREELREEARKKSWQKKRLANRRKREERMKQEMEVLGISSKDAYVEYKRAENLERLRGTKKRKMVERYEDCHGPVIAFDFYFEAENTLQGKRKIVNQIQHSSGFCKRKAGRPLKIALVGVSEGFQQLFQCNTGHEGWPVKIHPAGLLEVFSREQIVYLSPDAEETLEVVEEDKVYVVGAIVDRNVKQGLSKARAEALGVRAVKLPMHLAPKGYKRVLTLNHMYEVMCNFASGMSFPEALEASESRHFAVQT